MRRTALVLAACALATGCSNDPEPTSAPADGVASPASSAVPGLSPVPAATPSGAGAPALAADTAPDEQAPQGGPLSVTAVRVARQDGYDRVVLELAGKAGGRPGWRVQYEDDPRRAGSGDPVDVDGAATLVVLVDGAGYPMDTGVDEVSGDPTVPGDTEVVEDVELGAVFEGTYEAFVGVSRRAPFRVFRLEDPARVVIDVRHD